MKVSTVRRRLQEARVRGRIVTVDRDAFELNITDGFVMAITDNWVVVHALDGVYLDDIVLLRLEDISRVSYRSDTDYHHRAVSALDEDVATLELENAVDVPGLIRAVSARAQIFAAYCEVLEDQPLAIGRLVRLRRKSFDLHYVGRDGVWASFVERWKYRDVSRIEVGGRYLTALNRFADPYPPTSDVVGGP